MDVIDAARKISEAGTKLDDLARKIADQCAESTTKKDLLAYLERITLYCHQLNITSRVRYTQKSPKLQRLTMQRIFPGQSRRSKCFWRTDCVRFRFCNFVDSSS